MIRVSIVVPVYKVPVDKLKKCIDSIINQSYKLIEIVLVDDGSPDDCGNICDRYAEKDKRVIVVHQENRGLSGARNAGQRKASGEYITFVDGDDYLDLDAIERMVQIAEEFEPSIICTKHKAASEHEAIGSYPYESKKCYSTQSELYYMKEKLLDFNGNNNSSCGKLYLLSFLKENDLYHDEELKQGAEDIEFNYRVFDKAKSIVPVEDGFYNCVFNPSSITRSFDERNSYLIVKCFYRLKEVVRNDDSMMDWFYNRFVYAIIATMISGFFNPNNDMSFLKKRKKASLFLEDDLVRDALKYGTKKPLDSKRRIVLWMIKKRFFGCINLLGIIRFKQKSLI